MLNEATELCPENCKAYHQLGMFHFNCVEYYQKTYGNDALRYLAKHLAPAANSFFDAISLSTSTSNSLVLQDLLRLLTLFFTYGSLNEMSKAMKDGINIISVDTWLNVIPQLVARIHIENVRIKKQLVSLLTILTKAHPQALIYPLTVSASSEIQSRQATAKEILNSLRRDVPELVKEAEIVCLSFSFYSLGQSRVDSCSHSLDGDVVQGSGGCFSRLLRVQGHRRNAQDLGTLTDGADEGARGIFLDRQ